MAYDENEFNSRRERDARLKNIDYQIEEEQQHAISRKEKDERTRKRNRDREKKKEQESRHLREEKAKAAKAKAEARKKEQAESRDIMEQQRNTKKKLKEGTKKSTATSNPNQESSSTVTYNNASNATQTSVKEEKTTKKIIQGKDVIIQEISGDSSSEKTSSGAKIAVDIDKEGTEIYIDSEEATEKDLPSELVKRIRKEKEKILRGQNLEEEQQDKAFLGGIAETDDINAIKNEKLNLNRKKYRKKKRSRDGIYPGIPMGLDVQNKNVNVSGKYGTSNKPHINTGNNNVPPKSDAPSDKEEERDSAEDTTNNNTNTSKNNENEDLRNSFNDRESLRNDLMGLNNNTNNGKNNNANNTKNNNKNSSNAVNPNKDNNTNDDFTFSNEDVDNNTSSVNKNAGAFMGGAMGASMANNTSTDTSNSSSRYRPRPSTSTSAQQQETAGAPQDDWDRSNRQALNNIGRAARTTRRVGKAASKAAKTIKTAMRAKKIMALGPLLSILGIILLLVILIIGIVSFITNMPGMVRDKIVDYWDNFWQEAKGLIVGQDQPTATDVKNMAEYLENNMKYDLLYNGFVTKLEKDEKGNIKDLESKYLPVYIAADNRSYMLANENRNVKEIWDGVSDWLMGSSVKNDVWGTGMIVLEETALRKVAQGLDSILPMVSNMVNIMNGLVNYFFGDSDTRGGTVENLSELSNRVIIKRDTKELFISSVDIVKAFNRGGYDVYRYSLKEWTAKYGTPFELFVTLHLATRAPEFAYNFATLYDTKVFINIKELTNVKIDLVYAKTDSENRVVLEDGKPVMIPISEMSESQIKAMGLKDDALEEMRNISGRITAFTPYITKVLNHWYYQQVIFQGEYEGKNIDVYKIKSLTPGTPGYERYYVYTRLDNADAPKMEAESEKIDPPKGGIFGNIFDTVFQVMQMAFAGNFSGISDFLESASEELIKESFNQLSDAVVDEISDKVMGALPDNLAGMLNVRDFLRDGLSFESWQNIAMNGIDISNMTQYVDFSKITNQLDIPNLNINIDNLFGELNLQTDFLNLDLSNLTNIDDLSNVIGDLDVSNLNKVFDEGFANIVDVTNANFDKLTNQLANGFTSSIGNLQNSILSSCDKIFAGLNEADFENVANNLLGGVTKNITDLTSGAILNNLTSSIQDVISGQFDAEVLAGLQNEFAKQVTGLSYTQLEQLASIPGMDFNQITNLSTQITGIDAALKGAENSMQNLTHKVNQLAKDITGMDTRILNSVSKGLTDFDTKISAIAGSATNLNKAIFQINPNPDEYSANVLGKVDEINEKVEKLGEAVNNLDTEAIKILEGELNTYIGDVNAIVDEVSKIEDNTIGQVEKHLSQLKGDIEGVVKHIEQFDIKKLETLKYKVADLDKSGVVKLALDLSSIDMEENGVQELIKRYGTDLTNLNTSELNLILKQINDKNVTAQEAISGITGYLMRIDETELANSILEVNGIVTSINELTQNFDADTALKIASNVTGIDKNYLNNMAGQIIGMENVDVIELLNNVEELPNQILGKVTEELNKKITEGIKDRISDNLSEKLKDKIETDTFKSGLKTAMTTGDSSVVDTAAQDEAIEAPQYEYSTGFYIREIREADYFQIAEPLRVLYSPNHWYKMFREDKYVILSSNSIDKTKLDDPTYINQVGKTIWEATDGNVEKAIYALLQGVPSTDAQYLFRYFKELFNDFDHVFEKKSLSTATNAVKDGTIGWIFKTAKFEEPIFVGEPKEHSKKTEKVIISNYENKQFYMLNDTKDVTDLTSYMEKNMPEDASYYEYTLEEDDSEGYAKVNGANEYKFSKSVNEILEDIDFHARMAVAENSLSGNEPEGADSYTYTYRCVAGSDAVITVTYKDDGKVVGTTSITLKNTKDIVDEAIEAAKKEVKTVVDISGPYNEGTLEIVYYKYEGTEYQWVEKAEYEPATWAASKTGILTPKSEDKVYGFEKDLAIVSPVNGVVISKTNARRNELGEITPQSVTIELRDTGDENADGMRLVLIGGDYSNDVMVGTLVKKVEYTYDTEKQEYSADNDFSVIGRTTDEPIKIMLLDKDQTPVEDISQYIYPPYEKYKAMEGNVSDERKQ